MPDGTINLVLDLGTSPAVTASGPGADVTVVTGTAGVVVNADAPAVTIGVPGNQGPTGAVGPAGPTGPQGAQGVWMQKTQAQYDALPVKDPNVLYVIVG